MSEETQQPVTDNKINWLLFPIMNLYYIFINFLNGVYFVFLKLPKIIYEIIVYNFNKIFRPNSPIKGAENIVGEDKPTGVVSASVPVTKKQKTFKYSAKKLAKLEKEKEQLLKELQDPNTQRSKEPLTFVYVAKNSEGKIVSDTMSGFSKVDINAFLVSEGYEVYDIKTSEAINFVRGKSTLFQTKFNVKDLIFWLTQLSTYLKAGITLSEAVKILSKQIGKKSKAKQKALMALSYELSIGQSFSTAMEKQGNMFPSLLINMVKAAEATGTLIDTLDDMAEYYTETDKTRKQMVSAMTYPAIITFFALGVSVFIMVYVIPKFVTIYESSNIEIPTITKVVIAISNFLTKNGLLLLLVLVLLGFGVYMAYKHIKSVRLSIQTVLMKLPIMGNIIIYNELTIFTKTFASLLKNNVFITNSMEILSKITNNEIYKGIMNSTINNIVKGNKISDSFKDQWAIPEVAYYMIVTGESTGELAEMMQKVSEYYQEMHRNIVNNLKAFIEPIMIALLAVIVGGIILAVVIPMFGMYNAI